jgi:hypothetical protein
MLEIIQLQNCYHPVYHDTKPVTTRIALHGYKRGVLFLGTKISYKSLKRKYWRTSAPTIDEESGKYSKRGTVCFTQVV